MPSSPRYLIIPERGRRDIQKLLSFSSKTLQAIRNILGSQNTLRSEEPSYQILSRDAGITNEEAFAVLNAVANLTIQKKRYRLTDEQLLEDLKALRPGEAKEAEIEAPDILLGLLSDSEDGYLVDKAESLKAGFSPHLISFRSICDARPVFNKDRTKIEGMLLVTSLGITTHDENHEAQTFVLQMTRKDLERLREALTEAERKLSIIGDELKERFDILP